MNRETRDDCIMWDLNLTNRKKYGKINFMEWFNYIYSIEVINMETYLHHPLGNDASHFRCDFALWIVVEIDDGMCFFGFEQIFKASFGQKCWIGWGCVDLWLNVHHLVYMVVGNGLMIFECFLFIAHQIHCCRWICRFFFLLQPNDFRNDDNVNLVAVATDNSVYVLFLFMNSQCSYNYELC